MQDLEAIVEAGVDDASQLGTTDGILRSIAKRLSELTSTPVADVYLVEAGTMRCLVSYDGGRFDGDWEGTSVPLARYPCELKAVQTGQIAVMPTLDDPLLGPAARSSLERWGYQSQLAVPLMAAGRVIGIIELSDFVPRTFAEHLDLISGLGQVAARNLESGRLFEQIDRRNRLLNELVELSTFAWRCQDFDTVVRRVAERLVQVVGAANCDIYQDSPEGLRCLVSFDRSGLDERAVGRLLDVQEYPTLTAAFTSGQVMVIGSPDDPQLTDRERDVYRDYGFASEVCLPIVVGDELFGLIDLYDTRERQYTEYLPFLQSLANSLAGAFGSTRLLGDLERRTAILHELVELGAITSQSRDVRETVAAVAERLRKAIGAADCDVFRLDGDVLRCVVSVDERGIDQEATDASTPVDRFPMMQTAIHMMEPAIVKSPDDPRLTDREREIYAEWGYKSELCIPLVADDEVIGLVEVFDERPRDYAEQVDFLKSVGQILAATLKNALLHDDVDVRERLQEALIELGRLAMAGGRLETLLQAVGRTVTAATGATGCQTFRLTDDVLTCLSSWEEGVALSDAVGHTTSLASFPSTKRALDRAEILEINGPDTPGLSDAEARHYRDSPWRSDLAVPLSGEAGVVGMLEIYDRTPRDLGPFRDFLMSVGHIVAGALEADQLLERLERTNRQLTHLVEAGLEFGGTLDPAQLLESVARRLVEAADAAGCDISSIEGDQLRCVTSVENGELDEAYAGTTFPLDKFAMIQQAIAESRPFTTADIAADPDVSDAERAIDLSYGHRSKVELPLITRGTVVGVASIFDNRPRAFGDLDLLQSLAQVAANALANADLYSRLDKSAERMALVNEVSYELSSTLDLDQVLLNTGHRLCAVADMPCCDIYTLDDQRDLTCVVSLVDGEVDMGWQGHRFPLDSWAALTKAVDTRQPVTLENLDDPLLNPGERALMQDYAETAEIIFPLISKDEVIGVLELLETRGPRSFSDDEVATIASVCRVAALAIDNADLVEDLQLRNRENELLYEIAQATTASLDLPAVASAAVEKLGALVPLQRAMLTLRRGDAFELIYATHPDRDEAHPFEPGRLTAFADRLAEDRVLFFRLPEDAEELRSQGLDGLASAAVIALSAGEGLSGILSLGSEMPDAFTAVDRRLLERVATQLALALNNAELYDDIKRMHLGNLKALSSALNAKDYYTLGHAARVAAYMVLLGEELGWKPELLAQVEEAAYLHDIGKIGVSDRVLLKPSTLNPKEWELMRQHPAYSSEIIRPLFPEDLVLGVRHHHERYDGSGYPDGFGGESIPEIARAMCVVDSYDAMSFRRPYRQALTYPECLEELERCSGTQFDPAFVGAFRRVLERMAATREQALAVAVDAASRVDPEVHQRLQRPQDESSPEYRRVVEVLRAVRDEHPPTRFLSTFVRQGKKTVLITDAEEDERLHSRLGDDTFVDEEINQVLAGWSPDQTVLYVDQFGAWISGTAPLRNHDGDIVAAVSADLPAATGETEVEGLRSDVTQTFATMVEGAAARIGRTEVEAITDGLTGLYNHRYFHERLDEELDRCLDRGTHLALLFLDLDDFHAFNERHGHSAGDRALRAVARIVEGSLRHVDVAARYGGEEFAAVLVDAHEEAALEVAERIRNSILGTRFTAGPDSLSVSIGLAVCPADATHKEELIDKADWAMYVAKRRGRNQVIAFSAEHGSVTPEQAAVVTDDVVASLGEVAAARAAYLKRRRAAVSHLALAVGRARGMGGRELRAVAAAAAAACDGSGQKGGRAAEIAALAATYEGMVTGRGYRGQLSEAEALQELGECPAFLFERELLDLFASVLAGRGQAKP